MSRPVVIVGGGWAGLSAADELLSGGVPVILFERRHTLGGRSSSFYDQRFGGWLDNGPHLFIGAYTRSLRLLGKWGTANGISFADGRKIGWINRDGSADELEMGGGRWRLSMVGRLMQFRRLPLSERIRTLFAVNALLKIRPTDPDGDIASFLSRFGIDPLRSHFWKPLTDAVMNLPAASASILPFARAVQEGLDVDGLRHGVPTLPFADLVVEPALRSLESLGGEIRHGVDIRRVETGPDGAVSGVTTADGTIAADKVILAVPPHELLRVLPPEIATRPFFARFRQFGYSPIACVHLDFDRPVLNRRFGLLTDSFTHWIFTRGNRDEGGWRRLSCIISAAPSKEEIATEQLERKVIGEVSGYLKTRARIIAVRTVRTVRATVALHPGVEALRPDSGTPVKGLYIAGDWCNTGLPATIEGAARSGYNAANLILTGVR